MKPMHLDGFRCSCGMIFLESHIIDGRHLTYRIMYVILKVQKTVRHERGDCDAGRELYQST